MYETNRRFNDKVVARASQAHRRIYTSVLHSCQLRSVFPLAGSQHVDYCPVDLARPSRPDGVVFQQTSWMYTPTAVKHVDQGGRDEMYVVPFIKGCHESRQCDDIFPDQKVATYVNLSLQHESCIDYCLTSNPSSIMKFNVLEPDINFSDHLPLFIEIMYFLLIGNRRGTPTNQNENLTRKFLRWHKADLVSYYYHSGTLLLPILSQVSLSLIHI